MSPNTALPSTGGEGLPARENRLGVGESVGKNHFDVAVLHLRVDRRRAGVLTVDELASDHRA